MRKATFGSKKHFAAGENERHFKQRHSNVGPKKITMIAYSRGMDCSTVIVREDKYDVKRNHRTTNSIFQHLNGIVWGKMYDMKVFVADQREKNQC